MSRAGAWRQSDKGADSRRVVTVVGTPWPGASAAGGRTPLLFSAKKANDRRTRAQASPRGMSENGTSSSRKCHLRRTKAAQASKTDSGKPLQRVFMSSRPKIPITGPSATLISAPRIPHAHAARRPTTNGSAYAATMRPDIPPPMNYASSLAQSRVSSTCFRRLRNDAE